VEVELKLALDPADVARFHAAAALAGARPHTKRMDAIYLDTRDREIARNAMALRVRRAGKRWMQCLKAGASGTGGLHSRAEWEIERPGPEMDLSLFRDTPLAALPSVETLHQRLAPAFRVTFERTAWTVEPAPGTRLEVSLDQGEVRAKSRSNASRATPRTSSMSPCACSMRWPFVPAPSPRRSAVTGCRAARRSGRWAPSPRASPAT
jgi:inorganic triphosphatase YgiF